MKTYIMEGVATALSSICHNGGERNGISSLLRREKFIQPDGDYENIPLVSGNSIRGVLRDVGMYYMLQRLGYGIEEKDGSVIGLPLPAFDFLFSGGALTSTGTAQIDVSYIRKLKETIPLVGLFGGAVGNTIIPGKLKVGKMIPIAEETLHIIPEKFRIPEAKSVWDYCQLEMYVRKDDEKNDKLRGFIEGETRKLLDDPDKRAGVRKSGPQQMMYYTETIAAGTKFFWKIALEDVTDVEFEAFLTTLLYWSKFATVGGKSATGLGEIAIKMDKWIEIDSRAHIDGHEIDMPIGKKYEKHLADKKAEIIGFLNGIK
jgi:hypothetical protein